MKYYLIFALKKKNKYFNIRLFYYLQIAQEHGVTPLEQTADFKQRCDEDAYEIVSRIKSLQVFALINFNCFAFFNC